MKIFFILSCAFMFWNCSSTYPNQNLEGKAFPTVQGESLDQKAWTLPQDMQGKTVIFLMGYVQNTQFDIDRWLIGLDQLKSTFPVYELPTIKGMLPRFFKTKIDQGMRRGIPKELWKGVITIYKDGKKLQQFTGNQNPNNARVILLDSTNVIRFFYDQGFSVKALNELLEKTQTH